MNFDYLKKLPDMGKLYDYCSETEEFVSYKPNISATSARKAMEYVVKTIYGSIIGTDYGYTVFDMITDYRFIDYIDDSIFINSLHYIRKMGNIAVHDGEITKSDSMRILEELHFVIGEFCILLGLVRDYPVFEKPDDSKMVNTKTESDVEEKVIVDDEIISKYGTRLRYTKFDVSKKRDEEENKRLFMSASFREAGWPIVNVPDQAIPMSIGFNMLLDEGDTVDWVMYGRDNRPLAIVEYTTTKENLVEGRMKGMEKASRMEVKYGYKPVVYYTNGYFIYVIDQLGYKPRRVFDFHSLDELELLILRKNMRQDISNPVIDDNITNRYYQKEAIMSTCKAFSDMRRRSLLVMATGTGKTRVSISLVDVLMKANWVKNVLFLADRTSLVRQAHKNFTKLLPSVTTTVYAGGSMNRDSNARIVFSTYQSMIKLINDETREFGVGRFDLIVIDEAHRSIFKKYGALFKYFDALMIGLTATPRSEDNKSTYDIFEMENGKPDYAYELEEAIKDKYLVGFSVLNKTTENLKRGTSYDDLSDEDKEKVESALFLDEDESENLDGEIISSDELRRARVVDLGTIDVMLKDLMDNGLKVNGGDKIGKTIIFAKHHFEAEKIVERFHHLYPTLGSSFCKLIDSKVEDNLSLIDSFGERGQLPQVAVSVDMMDTGIDVPDVLNLVFFKPVQSKIKFLQMIGRGTRLSPAVFGPGLDKEGFYIFDYYDNFGYFKEPDTWKTGGGVKAKGAKIKSQSVAINEKKLEILEELTENSSGSDFDEKFRDELKTYFLEHTRHLVNDDIQVQLDMPYVNKYRVEEQWELFTPEKMDEIRSKIIPLFPAIEDDNKVKIFDLLMFVVESQVTKRLREGKDPAKIKHGFGNVFDKIAFMLKDLKKLTTIPAVVSKMPLIDLMLDQSYLLDDFSIERCEAARRELRDLMQFIPDNVFYYTIHTEDMVIDADTGSTQVSNKPYPVKAQEYLVSGKPVLSKIMNLDPLSDDEKAELEKVFKEELGSESDFISWSGGKALLPFLRVQLGISDHAIETKFGSFMNSSELNSMQLSFMEQIVSFVRENGDITFLDLQNVSPFCDIDIMEVFGAKVAHIKTLINGLHKVIM